MPYPSAESSSRLLLLGFDIGSHSCKGVLVDTAGEVVAEASRSHRISRPQPGWEEQSPAIWWEAFVAICAELRETVEFETVGEPYASGNPGGRRLVRHNGGRELPRHNGGRGLVRHRGGSDSGQPGSRISAIGITGFVPGLCMVDAKGQPIGDSIMHTDTRAMEELEELNGLLDTPISMGTLLPKLRWVQKHQPERFSEIDTLLVPHGYLVYSLTGRRSCDYDTASIFGGLFDSGRRRWNERICRELQIPLNILPPTYPAVGMAGVVSAEAANATGLPAGTPVIVGSGDSFTALVGAGASEKGDLLVYMGTSGTRLLVERPLEEVAEGPHFGPGKIEFVGRIFSCGDTLERFRRLLGDRSWKELDDAAEAAPAGAGGLFVVPHLKQRRAGESELSSRDSMVGYGGAQEKGHIFRSALEGVALLAREGADEVMDRVLRVVVSGGPVKSAPVRRIMAAVFGGQVLADEKGHSGVGAAILAGYARGNCRGLDRNVLNTCKQTGIVEADTAEVDFYARHLHRFRDIRRRLHAGDTDFDPAQPDGS